MGTALLAPAVATGLGLAPAAGARAGRHLDLPPGVSSSPRRSAGCGAGWSRRSSACSCINYFFTEPLHTLRVTDSDDAVALVAFLVVAAIVGSLVARALEERARAARGEREARLLSYLATKVLSGERLDGSWRTSPARCSGRCTWRGARSGRRTGSGTYEIASPATTRRPARSEGSPSTSGARCSGRWSWSAPRASHRSAARTSGCSRRPRGRSRSRWSGRARRAGPNLARLDAETNQARAALFSSVTPRPADPARVDQGGGHEPARRRRRARRRRSGASCCRRCWRRPTGSTGSSATSSTSRSSGPAR